MAQTNAPNSGDRPVDPMQATLVACRTDDVSLMEQAISIASQASSRHTRQHIVQRGLNRSAARGAIRVLRYVLDQGADVQELTAANILATDGGPRPSLEVLEILIAHGWDIDTQGAGHTSWPLLWLIVRYDDLVVWCLEHGASVDIPNDPPKVDAHGVESHLSRPRPTILGMAASQGSVETFELLRAKHAPMDPRTLHHAVEQATLLSPEEGSDERSLPYQRRMDMVRHLVDVVGLDVNGVAHEIANTCSTPLCFPACRPTKQDFHELVDFLLDRGGDPYLTGVFDDGTPDGHRWLSPIACAQHFRNERFLSLVQQWQDSHKPDPGAG